jgi:uncharacterized RDD family membrane protein YckC
MTAGGVSPVPREARSYQGQGAGLVTRLVASGIDAVVVLLLLLLGFLGINGVRFMFNPVGFTFTGISVLFSLVAGLVVLVVYLTVAWATTGRTYGCHVMGLRVVSRRGRRLRPHVAFLRAVGCALFPIGLFWCAGGRTHHSVHDILFRTDVIYDWMPREERGIRGQWPSDGPAGERRRTGDAGQRHAP